MELGIDRIVLKALDINQIDATKLKKSYFFQENGQYFRLMLDTSTGSKLKVSYIKVSGKDELRLNELNIGVKKVTNQLIHYEYLDVTLPSLVNDNRTNISPIQDSSTFIKSLRVLEEELLTLGFGEVNLLSAEIEELEINATIPLEHKFSEYREALTYFNGLLPKTYKKAQEYQNRVQGEYTGFKVFNNSISLKMYNKKAQVLEAHNIDLPQELLRIEYRLLDGTKVKDFLGHNSVGSIAQDFSQIEKTFKAKIEKDLVNKIQKDIDKQITTFTKLMIDNKQPKGTLEKVLLIHGAFDISIVLGALKKIDTTGNYIKECRKAIRLVEKIEHTNMMGNVEKINEILEKLGYKPIKIKMTKVVKNMLQKHL